MSLYFIIFFKYFKTFVLAYMQHFIYYEEIQPKCIFNRIVKERRN